MEAYGHLRVLISMILGLAITRILAGLSRRIQSPQRTRGMLLQVVWALIVLLGAVHFWWWEFGLRQIGAWHFGAYAFVLAYTALHFLMATLIFPDSVQDHGDTEQFFALRRRWFFALFALSFCFDYFDTLMKGVAHVHELGPEYPVRLLLGIAVGLAGCFMQDRRHLTLLGLGWLSYDLSWILRRYDLLS